MIPTTYDPLIKAAVEKFIPALEYQKYKAQLWEESKFKPGAVSHKGASGFAQFMPDTWAEWSPRAGFAGAPRSDIEASIFTGACYMGYLWGEWSSPRPADDRFCLAAASYNSGLGDLLDAQVAVGGKVLYAEIVPGLRVVEPGFCNETIRYVERIWDYYKCLLLRGG